MNDLDRVYIVPRYSEIERKDIDLSITLFDWKLFVPVISSPMDTVSNNEMLQALKKEGCIGIQHRYCDLSELGAIWGGVAVSPSMKLKYMEKLRDAVLSNIVVLDVAHGHTKRNLEFCANLKNMGWDVIGGSIATKEAAEAYLKIGVDHIRVGIGSGSVCTTRLVTGVGRPQYIAIKEIREEFRDDIHIIADGGHRTTGDIAKSFALGADYVMLGRMLACTKEARNDGIYSGMASSAALRRNGKTEFFVEGKSEIIEVNRTVHEVIAEIRSALETTCYYAGVRNLKELAGNYEIE